MSRGSTPRPPAISTKHPARLTRRVFLFPSLERRTVDHFINIYSHLAREYHDMIAMEDADGNVLAAIEQAAPLRGKRVLDIGSGTGRLPLLLAPYAAQVVALDLHRDMLTQHAAQRKRARGTWPLVQGDMRRLPFPAGWADVVTAGWAIGHLRGWYADDWKTHIGMVLNEMQRAAAPGGTLIIFETLTTGSLTPAPPTEELAAYYAWLEMDWGFARQAFRTDYQFAGVEEAVAHTEFFFGPELAAKIRENGWARLPEWTGMWLKRAA